MPYRGFGRFFSDGFSKKSISYNPFISRSQGSFIHATIFIFFIYLDGGTIIVKSSIVSFRVTAHFSVPTIEDILSSIIALLAARSAYQCS